MSNTKETPNIPIFHSEHSQMYELRRRFVDPIVGNKHWILTGDAIMAMFLYFARTHLSLRLVFLLNCLPHIHQY